MSVPAQRPGPREDQGPPSHDKPIPDHKIRRMDRDRTAHKSPDRLSRSSFSSIRETDSDLTQTFTSSKVSTYLSPEEALDDSSPSPSASPSRSPTTATTRHFDSRHKMVETQFLPPLTRPESRLHGYWVPADNFKGWKQINVKGKLASKSFGDLQVLNSVWSSESRLPRRQRGRYAAGQSPFEKLPVELLTSIINLLVLDIPPNGIARRNVDLMSLLCASRTLHSATLGSLYHKITIPHSRIFQKFLAHVSGNPVLGTIVRRMDFCHFNPGQLFSSAAERSQARNLTSETLLKCLELTPNLHEFLAQEYIDDDLDVSVLQKLFYGMPRLQAVDFCGCSSTAFKNAFTAVVTPDWPVELSITRLSLHKCMTLPSSVFEAMLPRLPKLTHLDVAGTRITDVALASIPHAARLTHLNLAKCNLLTARNIIDFLAGHPAARHKLTFLSVATDARSHQIFDSHDVAELLTILPDTLKSLSLKGSKMEAFHIELLRPLTKHLEELALGRNLSLSDVHRLFVPDVKEDHDMNGVEEWVPQTLRFLDISDMWGGDLDLGQLFGSNCAIMTKFSEPLTVLEIPDDVARRLTKSPAILSRVGWKMSDCGSRTWLVRDRTSAGTIGDDGRRSWKMGAESWGMRKIPVAEAEVGGMYGSYMFSRKL